MFLAGSAHNITFHAPVLHDTWLLKLLKMAFASLGSIPKVVLISLGTVFLIKRSNIKKT